MYRREKLCFEQYLPMSYLSDMDDLDQTVMTCSDFVNALKMLICSENSLFLEHDHGYSQRVVIDRGPRWLTI